MRSWPRSLALLLLSTASNAAITVYNQNPFAVATASAADPASYTGPAAYNPTTLAAPPVPSPPPPQRFNVQVQKGGVPGLSIKQNGAFFGFSIEMSVSNQVLGRNSTFIHVPFLNLMSNLVARGGSVHVRVGGNTQEQATLVDTLPDGRLLQKDLNGTSNPTQTPPLLYTPELLYMMGNISAFTNVRWYLGIPFNDTSNFKLAIAERGQAILGDKLIGLQAGNEPDLYARHGHRPPTYSPQDYMGELDVLIKAMGNDANARNRNLLIGPNIATGDWTPQMMLDAGFIGRFSSSLTALAVEHYPSDNCFAQFQIGVQRTPQSVFPEFLNHTAAQSLVGPYAAFSAAAQQAQKPLIMFETNTASCGGFPGISDSFGAALWATDYAMQMAAQNFSGALFHVGGQNVFYNPFTAPPTNQSSFHQWTIGSVYYAAIAMAEAMGTSGQAQVIDLNANGGNIFTPAYAIYENGDPSKVALFNFVTDPSGGNDLTVTVGFWGVGAPGSVRVKYLRAPSVSTKANLTWAGQTFGGHFDSDGRFAGTEDVQTVQCNAGANTCDIKVPAPSFALVFLSPQAPPGPQSAPTTFATTVHTRTHNTATVDRAVLATSNGHRVGSQSLGSTSREKVKSGAGRVGVGVVFGGILAGVLVLPLGWRRML